MYWQKRCHSILSVCIKNFKILAEKRKFSVFIIVHKESWILLITAWAVIQYFKSANLEGIWYVRHFQLRNIFKDNKIGIFIFGNTRYFYMQVLVIVLNLKITNNNWFAVCFRKKVIVHIFTAFLFDDLIIAQNLLLFNRYNYNYLTYYLLPITSQKILPFEARVKR